MRSNARIKVPALWVDCPGLAEGRFYHSMRDYCSSCAPWWERVALCPVDRTRLTDRGHCRTCRAHFDLTRPTPGATEVEAGRCSRCGLRVENVLTDHVCTGGT